MSNHFSAANLKSPGDDTRLDVTDLYVFPAPGNHDKTVMIIDADPSMAAGSALHPDAVYRINVDNNRDIRPDAAFSFVFPPLAVGEQTATGYYATGQEARQPEPADDPATHPNGRLLTDDVYGDRFAWLTYGQVGSDGLQPHDLTAQFPCLGPPNR